MASYHYFILLVELRLMSVLNSLISRLRMLSSRSNGTTLHEP